MTVFPLARFLRASIIVPDGMPSAWLAALIASKSKTTRVPIKTPSSL